MEKNILPITIFPIIFILYSSIAFAYDWDDAKNAFRRGKYKEAIEMMKPFAEKGNSTAQYYLGLMYRQGKGGSKKLKEAVKWFRLLAEKDYPQAQYQIAEMYEKGEGVPKSYQKAAKWYRKVALKGYVDAQFKLGEMYEKGQGVSKNLKEALEWYKLVAEQKFVDAQHKVGQMYYQGMGTPSDYFEASKWYELSANQDFGPAQADLGKMYYQGQGVQVNFVQAHMWLSLAFANEQELATSLLPKLEKEMTPQQIARAQGLVRSWRPGAMKSSPSNPSPSQKTQSFQTVGTGFFVSSDGYILTNHHVVEACVNIQARGYGALQFVNQDQLNDLALLKTELPPKGISIFRETTIKLGSAVRAAGFPLQDILAESMNITEGTISSMAGINNDSRFIQTTAPVQQGNSGGPLLDTSGLVAGVVTSKLNVLKEVARSGDIPQNVNFAIHASVAKRFLEVNNITFLSSQSKEKKENSLIADIAKKITLAIECAN
mgnify:CR=1 FL=1